MIIRVTDMKVVPYLVEKLKGIKNWDISQEDMAIALAYHVNDPSWLILADIDDKTKELKCVAVSYIMRFILEPFVFLVLAWSNEKDQKSGLLMFDMIKKWAKAKGIKRVYGNVKGDLKAIKRKYGFKFQSFWVYSEVQ